MKTAQKKILVYGLMSFAALIFIGITSLGILMFYFSKTLPDLSSLTNYEPRLVTTLYSDKDEVLAEYSTEKRVKLESSEFTDLIKQSFISAEDDEFYKHKGVNFMTILRAAFKNFVAGRTVQGGSTITQQVAKTFFLSRKKSYIRKLKELLLAFRIEKALSKDEILSRYLNQIFLGHRSYGVEAAARTYFNKSSDKLNIAEAAMLAGLPRAPSRDNPITNPKAAKERQLYVLRRLFENNFITEEEYTLIQEEPLKIKNKQIQQKLVAPYFAEYVRQYVEKKYGEIALYEGGLKIYTTLNLEAQKEAQNAVNRGLEEVDRRLGLRAPKMNLSSPTEREEYLEKQHNKILADHFDYKLLNADGTLTEPEIEQDTTPLKKDKFYSAVLISKNAAKSLLIVQVGKQVGAILRKDWQWITEANPTEVYENKIVRNPMKQLKVGDLLTVKLKKLSNSKKLLYKAHFSLEQKALVQGALLSYRVPDGALNAMVGGYDFYSTGSHFNRAVQAKRQPGSTFKPIVYGAAFEEGLTPASIIVDAPIVYKNSSEENQLNKIWKPGNYGSRSYGDTTLRNALAHSRNIPTIKLLQHLGINKVIEYSEKLGIESPLNKDLSLALGSSSLTLDELLRAWGVFANKGKKLNPYFIRSIEDRNGEILEEYEEVHSKRIIPEEEAFLMTSLLESVVKFGTATNVQNLKRPVAGKTGTTSDSKDALFIGYVPQMLTGVWIGFDQNFPVGPQETGGRAAAPIWIQYMKTALKEDEIRDFDVPNKIVEVKIDPETGNLPTAYSRNIIKEFFREGNAPGQYRDKAIGKLNPNASNKAAVITGNTGFEEIIEEDSEESNDELLRNEF